MNYHRGRDRLEVELLPPCLEDYVAAEATVRFIDEYVETRDLKGLGFTHAEVAATGRPPYHPADLVKLYVYGYLNRVRSSRRLEADTKRNLEVMWLLRRMQPDHKTIANFRKENLAAFKALFKDFNLLCRKLELFGAELVAIDGSKFKAVNSSKRHFSAQKLEELEAKVEAKIEEHLRALEEADQAEEGSAPAPTAAQLKEKIAGLKERQERYQELQREMQQSGAKEIALTDPDSRKMKGPHGNHYVGYNVQVAVDGKHHLIVAEEVVQDANDLGQLHALATAAKEELKVETLQVVADKGYHHADHLEACEEAKITAFVPAPERQSGRGKDGVAIFPVEKFCYDAATNIYACPQDHHLPYRREKKEHGRIYELYYKPSACAACPLRAQCTTGAYRIIRRLPNQAAVDQVAARVQAQPELVRQRKTIVEHGFGTLRLWGHDHFLLRGLAKVRAEFSLSSLAYNLRRVLNLLRIPALLSALRA